MANRVLEVILQAKDAASAVITKVETGLTKFGSGVSRVTKSVSDGLNSMMGRWLTVGGIGAILSKAVSASNEFEASVRKLAGTAKIAGVPLEFLQDVSRKAESAFGLSSVTANNLTTAVSKLAAKAGDLNMTGDLLERFLDLGAAKGLNAAETLKAVEQSILGIDEGTDKLFGANPSVLYEEFAEAIGKTAGKLTDQEKAMAIATAAMEDGGKVVGAYGEYLQSTAGQMDQAKEAANRAAITLGQVLAPAIKIGADIIEWLATKTQEFVIGLQIMALDIGEWAQGIGPNLKIVAGSLLAFLGDTFGKLRDLPLIGDKFGELADKLRATGGEMVETNRYFLQALNEETEKERMKLVAIEQSTGKKRVLETRNTGTGQVEEEKKTAKKREEISRSIAVMLLQLDQGLTRAQAEEAISRREALGEQAVLLIADLREAYKKHDELALLLAAGFDKEITPAVKQTTLALGNLKDAGVLPVAKGFGHLKADVDESTRKFHEMREAVVDGARGMVGFVGGLNGISGAAQAAAQNVITLGDSVAKIVKGGLSTEGMIGAMTAAAGALVGVFGAIFGGGESPEERARKQLLKENTEAIKQLTAGILDMSDVSSAGGLVAQLGTALPDIIKRLGKGGTGGGLISAGEFDTIFQSLGLSAADLLAVAEDLGIKITDDKGNIIVATLQQLLYGINSLKPEGAPFTWSEFTSWIGDTLGAGAMDPTRVWGAALSQVTGQRFGAGALGGLSAFDVTTDEGKAGAETFLRDLLLRLPQMTAGELGGFNFSEFSDAIQFFLEQLGVEGVGTGDWQPNLPGDDINQPPIDFGAAVGDWTDIGAQQVDYLASIDANIGTLITQWTDIDTGAAVSAGSASRGVVVEVGGITVNVAQAVDAPGAVAEEISMAINQSLATTYQAQQLARGVV